MTTFISLQVVNIIKLSQPRQTYDDGLDLDLELGLVSSFVSFEACSAFSVLQFYYCFFANVLKERWGNEMLPALNIPVLQLLSQYFSN